MAISYMKIKYALIIFIPLFIILFNLNLLIFNQGIYNEENPNVNENLLNYLDSKEELKFNYTEKEIMHMEDVKSLTNALRIIVYLLGFIIFLILITTKDTSKILIISGLVTIGIIIVLSLIDFSSLFTKFHEIFFMNDYWLLDENSLLIKTYPLEFFTDFFKRLTLNIIMTSIAVTGIGIIKNVHKQHKSSSP